MRKKHHPNSSYFKKKADDTWSLIIRSIGYCEMCGKEGRLDRKGRPIVGLHAHHVIGRTNPAFRWDYMNGLCLCISCHGSHPNFRNRKRSAHSSGEQKARFNAELKIKVPEKWAYWQENKDSHQLPEPYTYEEVYDILKKDLQT